MSKRFGGLQALSDVGFTITQGEIYGLIGPNGAGKTTLFNVLTGIYTPDAGAFELDGEPYKPSAGTRSPSAGIARTFQNIRLFANLSALENVMIGRHVRTHAGVVGAVLRTPRTLGRGGGDRRRARCELLDYVGIAASPRQRPRQQPVLRRPAPARDRARARHRAEAARARRARRRHERDRDDGRCAS